MKFPTRSSNAVVQLFTEIEPIFSIFKSLKFSDEWKETQFFLCSKPVNETIQIISDTFLFYPPYLGFLKSSFMSNYEISGINDYATSRIYAADTGRTFTVRGIPELRHSMSVDLQDLHRLSWP